MAVTQACTLQVDIADLQHAISSVVVHSEKQRIGDEQVSTCRVRLTAGATHLVVSATDSRTVGMAWVPILADSRGKRFAKDDGPFVVDLYPKQARQIGGAITPILSDGEATGEAELALALDTVTISDLTGKYPDTSTTVPTIEQEQTATLDGTESLGYPNLARHLGEAFTRGMGAVRSLLPPSGTLARFEAASRAYGQPLVVEQVGGETPGEGAWLVWCGERFAGLVVDRREDDAETRRRASRRLGYLKRLGVLSAENEARLELGGDVDEPAAGEGRFTEAEQLDELPVAFKEYLDEVDTVVDAITPNEIEARLNQLLAEDAGDEDGDA